MKMSRNRLFTLQCMCFFQQNQRFKKIVSYNHQHINLFTTLLLLCRDIETCPGPSNLSDLCKCRRLKFVHQNIRGLTNSFPSLEAFVYKEGSKIDVLELSEPHIVEGDESSVNAGLFELEGYTLIKRNRSHGKGGGVAMFVKNFVKFKRRHDLENPLLEIIVIEIFIKNAKSILVGCYYRPPEGSNYLPSNYNDLFNEHLANFSNNKEVILMGDFNVNYNSHSCNEEFKSIITANGFKQIINEPTRVTDTTSSVIDLVFANCPVNITQAHVIISSLSDHNMIGAVRKINNFKHPSHTINCRNYTKYDNQKFRNDVSEIDWSPVNNSNDVNVAVTHFNSALRKSIDSNAPLIEKRVKGRECKWLNAEIKSEMNARDQLHRKAQKSAKGNDWSMYKKQRNKCK